MSKFNLIAAIFQIVSALALVGISVYYYMVGNIVNFTIFLGVGVLFLAMSVRTMYKYCKDRKDK